MFILTRILCSTIEYYCINTVLQKLINIYICIIWWYTPAGDELEAKADAYPPASFVWVLAGEHKILSETSHLLVTEEMTHDWALEVRAYNEFRNETHSVSMKILVTRRKPGTLSLLFTLHQRAWIITHTQMFAQNVKTYLAVKNCWHNFAKNRIPYDAVSS